MSEAVAYLEVRDPRERLEESIDQVHAAIHEVTGEHIPTERLTYTFTNYSGTHCRCELAWTPIVDETGDVVVRPRLTIKDGDTVKSYLWSDWDTVQYYPPGQDDRPEMPGEGDGAGCAKPDRRVEFANQMDLLAENIRLFPEQVDVYAQDEEASKIVIVERIGQIAIAIADKAADWGMEMTDKTTLRLDYTDMAGVRHDWAFFFSVVERDDETVQWLPGFHALDNGEEDGLQLASATDIYHFTAEEPNGYIGDVAHMRAMKRRLDAFHTLMRRHASLLRLTVDAESPISPSETGADV
jgi:hypothetical protein